MNSPGIILDISSVVLKEKEKSCDHLYCQRRHSLPRIQTTWNHRWPRVVYYRLNSYCTSYSQNLHVTFTHIPDTYDPGRSHCLLSLAVSLTHTKPRDDTHQAAMRPSVRSLFGSRCAPVSHQSCTVTVPRKKSPYNKRPLSYSGVNAIMYVSSLCCGTFAGVTKPAGSHVGFCSFRLWLKHLCEHNMHVCHTVLCSKSRQMGVKVILFSGTESQTVEQHWK